MPAAEIPQIIALNYNEQLALKGVINDLTNRYSFIRKLMVYGSKARGDFLEDSDIDLLFVVDTDIQRSTKSQIYDIIYNHELLHDTVISAIFVSESDFRDRVNPFLNRVREEGILIWSRE